MIYFDLDTRKTLRLIDELTKEKPYTDAVELLNNIPNDWKLQGCGTGNITNKVSSLYREGFIDGTTEESRKVFREGREIKDQSFFLTLEGRNKLYMNKTETRLEMMRELYKGRGDIEHLEELFGVEVFEEVQGFLIDKNFIECKERSQPTESSMTNGIFVSSGPGYPLSYELTFEGEEYYKEQTQKKPNEKNMTTIYNQNGNVNVNSPYSQQTTSTIHEETVTPEIKQLLQELQKAIEKNNEKDKRRLLEKLKSGSENIFWNVIANGITLFVEKNV